MSDNACHLIHVKWARGLPTSAGASYRGSNCVSIRVPTFLFSAAFVFFFILFLPSPFPGFLFTLFRTHAPFFSSLISLHIVVHEKSFNHARPNRKTRRTRSLLHGSVTSDSHWIAETALHLFRLNRRNLHLRTRLRHFSELDRFQKMEITSLSYRYFYYLNIKESNLNQIKPSS